MSSTFTSSSATGASTTGVSTTTATKKTGNVGSFDHSTKGLTAVDTFGNVFEVPDYSIKDILKAIPPECYNRRVLQSFFYVFRDMAFLAAGYYVANTYIPTIANQYIRGALWAVYTIHQGLFGTGLWVLAHECGHQAFSDYGWLNDLTGWVLHSFLLVPYFSWKYSHSKHHKATGHLTRDTVFVPLTKDKFKLRKSIERFEELSEEAPLRTLYTLVTQQLGGWWAHLTTNVTGQPYEGVPRWKHNHFVPTSPIFDEKDYWYIVISDIGLLIQGVVLYHLFKFWGPSMFVLNYFIPYMWVNHWLVFITYLQHTAPTLPHYDASEWNFARGAAATIDRSFPIVGPYIFHDIIETHVLHHYVSRIPFYNARKGSAAIQKVMGKHYQHTEENMFVSLWKSARSCQYVDGDNGVRMFRNANKIGPVMPVD